VIVLGVPVHDFFFILLIVAVFAVLAVCAKGGGETVSGANLAGLVLSVVLTIFLVVALVFPEKF
jgi:K+-transporting ATPase KdpF subunit